MPNDIAADPFELESPFILSDAHLRRLLDGVLLAASPRIPWATLLRRTFQIDVLECPKCHGRLRLLAVIRDPEQARRFLAHVPKHTHARARDPTAAA